MRPAFSCGKALVRNRRIVDGMSRMLTPPSNNTDSTQTAHFFQQFAGPMTAWWKTFGSPALTPEVQKKFIASVRADVGSRTIEELEAERHEGLLALIELRTKRPEPSQWISIPYFCRDCNLPG
jgi:hypothetical protein